MRRGRRYAKNRGNASYKVFAKHDEYESLEIVPHYDEVDTNENLKSNTKRTKVLAPERNNLLRNQVVKKQKQLSYSPITSTKQQGCNNRFLLEEIQKFDLSAICEEENTQVSDESQEIFELHISNHGRLNETKTSFPVLSRRKKGLISSELHSEEQISIRDTMYKVLSAAISNAQSTQNETEIEVVLENAEDFSRSTDRPHREINFLHQALLNLSCTKHHSVKRPSVLARITVHVVPPRQTASDSCPEDFEWESQQGFQPQMNGTSNGNLNAANEKQLPRSLQKVAPSPTTHRGDESRQQPLIDKSESSRKKYRIPPPPATKEVEISRHKPSFDKPESQPQYTCH